MRTLLLFLALLFCGSSAHAQLVIHLDNPSFEGSPNHSTLPPGWDNKGFQGESPADTHPNGDFGVTQTPYHGETFLGMVTRDNDSWECVGQKLSVPFSADSCYQMALYAARSKIYASLSRVTQEEVNFNTPCRIRLWAGYAGKKGYELLAESELISSFDWELVPFEFTPTEAYDYLYLEAFYDSDSASPTNGNVLLDHLSPIVPCKMVQEPAGVYQYKVD